MVCRADFFCLFNCGCGPPTPILTLLTRCVKLGDPVPVAGSFHRFAHLCYNGKCKEDRSWLKQPFSRIERPGAQGGDA